MNLRCKTFAVLALVLTACSTAYEYTGEAKGGLADYASEKPDSALQQMMHPYSAVYQSSMNEVVGYLATDMEKGYPEGALGNFMADIFLDLALEKGAPFLPGNTFALFNNGGLRVPLQKGAVTRGKVFELMPFENRLVAVELSGSVLVKDLAAYLLAKKGQPLSRNVYAEFKNNSLVKMEINGRPVDTSARYIVLTSDYLSDGGDNMAFFKKGRLLTQAPDVKLRDEIIRYLQTGSTENKPIQAPVPGRIKID